MARRFVWVLLVLLVLPATADAAWRAPEALRSARALVNPVEAGIDGDGDATVVWTSTRQLPDLTLKPRWRSAVYTADVAADGTVGPARRLSSRGQKVHSARLAVAPDGRAAILWSHGPTRGERTRRARAIELLTRTPDGEWSKPRVLEAEGRNYAGDVIIEPDGTIAAAWTRLRAGGGDLFLRRYTFDGEPLSSEELGRGTAPKLAASPAFPRAVATFLRGTGPVSHDTYLYANGTTTPIGTNTYWRPEIAAGDRIAVAWSQTAVFGGSGDASMLTQFAPGGAAEVLRLSDADQVSLEPAVDARGGRVIAEWYWSDIDGPGDPRYDIRVYLGPGQPSVDPTPEGTYGMQANVALGDRRAAVVWSQNDVGAEGEAFKPILAGRVAAGNGPLGAFQRISARGEELSVTSQRPTLAMNAAGAAVVAYLATGADGPHLSVATLPE